jgi:hypothetical protein
MIQLSSPNAANPEYNFNLIYHGKTLGAIYFKYLRWNNDQTSSWQEASVFTFNNVPVKIDTTGGAHIYVIQLQQ